MAVVRVERNGTGPAGPDEGDLAPISAAARAVVPPDIWGYLQGGSGAERALRSNRAADDRVALRPRVLVDVSTISLCTSVSGPSGGCRSVWRRWRSTGWRTPRGRSPRPGGRGAGRRVLRSISASRTFAEMAGATAGPRRLQLY